LLRVRGTWWAFLQPALSAPAQGGLREQRFAAVMLAWRHAGAPTLDPCDSVDISNEGVLWHDTFLTESRDFITQAAGTPNEAQKASVSNAVISPRMIDIKAKRRVRSEDDRLILSFRARSVMITSLGLTHGDNPMQMYWALRFLYRTSR
jgi:hypothetical protein